MKRSPEMLVQMKVLQKPARNEYNTKQKKPQETTKKTHHHQKTTHLLKVANQIAWCFTMTKQRLKEERHEKPS